MTPRGGIGRVSTSSHQVAGLDFKTSTLVRSAQSAFGWQVLCRAIPQLCPDIFQGGVHCFISGNWGSRCREVPQCLGPRANTVAPRTEARRREPLGGGFGPVHHDTVRGASLLGVCASDSREIRGWTAFAGGVSTSYPGTHGMGGVVPPTRREMAGKHWWVTLSTDRLGVPAHSFLQFSFGFTHLPRATAHHLHTLVNIVLALLPLALRPHAFATRNHTDFQEVSRMECQTRFRERVRARLRCIGG